MKKRVLAMLMCLVIVITTLSTSAFAKEESPKVETKVLAETIAPELITENHITPLYKERVGESDLAQGGESLLAAEDEIYSTIEEAGAALREQMKERQSTITIKIYADENADGMAKKIYEEALAHTGVSNEGDYIAKHLSSTKHKTSVSVGGNLSRVTITYTITYFTTAEQEKEIDVAVDALLEELDLYQASDYEKVKGVYDWICSNVAYDMDDSEDTLKHSTYAALINRSAVCQGYASLMYRLMLELGVDVRVVTGTSEGESHGWNIVGLDGLYYNVDSTWDAGVKEYNYFLKCNANFPDHTRDENYTTTTFNTAYPMATKDYAIDAVIPEVIDSGKCGDNLTWKLTDDGVLTISGEGEMENYEGDGAPWSNYRSNIKTIIIGDNVTTIGDYAFPLSSVVNVVLPDSLTEIGYRAFYWCSNLRSMEIPAAVTHIGEDVFVLCTNMTRISVDEDNQHYSSDETGVLFDKSKSVLIQAPAAGIIGSYVVPESVKTISCYAFCFCDDMREVILPDSLTVIDEGAFLVCVLLKKIDLPDNLTYIGANAFDSDLRELSFAGNAPEISEKAFEGFKGSVYYPANNPTWTPEVIQAYGGEVTWIPYGSTNRLQGDVDSNGEISNTDLVSVARYIVELYDENTVADIEKYGDMNGDGMVNNNDLVSIARIIVGLV